MKPTSTVTAVSLLLTNLRLLDLPQNPDLPVNEDTFSLGRNKSKAFEHVAHHIFERYDPAECKSRFTGCWPIYEPAQSKNFRAAVIAWLTDLKRTGALHNGVIIRKSMFDDCQGERYEDLLLSLSTMALKRVVEREHREGLGNTTAFEEALSTHPDTDTTNVLTIAYQHSLKNTLQRRFVEKQKWFLASRRLEEQDHIAAEKESVTLTARESRRKPDVKEKDIKSVWEKNWIGDQSIYRLLLPENNDELEKDMWSEASFQRLLKTGSLVNKDASSSNSAALLDEMEAALRLHQNRTSRWSNYSEQFLKDRSGSKTASAKKVSFAADVGGGLGVDFNKHQDLHANAFTLQEGTQLPVPSAEDSFGKLFNSMRKELQTIRVSRRKLGTLSYAATYGESEEDQDDGAKEQETKPAQEQSKPLTGKDMTEEEALQLLTSHLPVDANPPKNIAPEPKANLALLRASLAASKASLAAKPPEPEPKPETPEPTLEEQSPKPRLRSPPPPPTDDESDESDELLDETIVPESFSPEIPKFSRDLEASNAPKEAEKPKYPMTAMEEMEEEEREPEEDDSVDDIMVERMIAQIASSADTPAPFRTQRVMPQAMWSKEELEEDPFKPRPKVALSPPLTPYRFPADRSENPETPRVIYSSTSYDDEDDDDEEDGNASPSKGRGRGYR